MPIWEAVTMALRTIRAQKLKSFFSLIGVLIGVMFLIAVVSIVQGMNVYMEDQFANRLIGLNTFQVRQRPSISTGDVPREVWMGWRRRPRITYADAEYLKARVTTPATMAMFCSDRMALSYDGQEGQGHRPGRDRGDLLPDQELRGRRTGAPSPRRKCARGGPWWSWATWWPRSSSPGQDPVGKDVVIEGLPYRIIGVVAKQGNLFGISLDKFAVMPYTAPARRYICPINILDDLQIQTAGPTEMQAAMAEVEALMRARRGLKPGQENNFHLQTAEGALEGWKRISRVLFMALPGLVAISLVVGGIVIMNIMLMAVSERTREIGIRKALGAKRRDILAQFVVESATLSTVGAAFGIGAGIALAFVVRALTPLPAAVAPWSIFVGVGLGIFVGMVAGVYPATRASRLDPIVALRAE